MRPERHQTNDPCLRIGALTVCTTRRQREMRAILVAVRYPDSRTVDTQYRQTAPKVGFNLLTSMTSDNGVKQVFEGGDTKSVTPLHQGRRADERLPVVIGEDQMPMVTY